jgi:hypothetical protein
MPHAAATNGSARFRTGTGPSTDSAAEKNISLDRKPLSSGTPAMAAAATMARVAVIGM